MSKNKVTRTIRCFVHDKERFEKMLSSVLKDFPGYVPINNCNTFKDVPESKGCPKLYIKAYRWHGEWSDRTCEVIRKYYKPKVE